jgi:hypothetical protein
MSMHSATNPPSEMPGPTSRVFSWILSQGFESKNESLIDVQVLSFLIEGEVSTLVWP